MWPFWLGIVGALAGIAIAVLRPIRFEATRWAAFAALAFVVPFMVAGLGSLDRQDEPDPYGLTPGVIAALRDLDDDDVVLAPIQTSYRVAAFAPVYVAAMPQSHVADTEENQSRERQRDVIRFFARGKLDDGRAAGDARTLGRRLAARGQERAPPGRPRLRARARLRGRALRPVPRRGNVRGR